MKVKCKKCGHEEEKTLLSLERGSRCEKCFPLYVSSAAEQEIEDFLRENGVVEVVRNSREIIPPKELDLYIPKNKFAIEYNGLYWHSEDKVGKGLSLEKTKLCLEKGITLFHVFSDEWIEKKEIVKSMLLYKLGIVKNKIFARECEIKIINNSLAREFYKNNHIAADGGNIKVSVGLFYKDELVSCLSMKNPYKKKAGNVCVLENARFASKINVAVVGGFSKLLNHIIQWAKANGYKSMQSFADRRFGEGSVYAKCGFSLTGCTKTNYWYSDGERRYFRTKFRAGFGKSENQIAEENCVFRVYGCGSNIYKLELK